MKRTLSLCLSILLMIGSAVAVAQEAQLYRPEEFDLSGVQEMGGRLTGEVRFPQDAYAPLKIDCAVPAGFAREQQQRLKVGIQEDNQAAVSHGH